MERYFSVRIRGAEHYAPKFFPRLEGYEKCTFRSICGPRPCIHGALVGGRAQLQAIADFPQLVRTVLKLYPHRGQEFVFFCKTGGTQQ